MNFKLIKNVVFLDKVYVLNLIMELIFLSLRFERIYVI